MACALAMIAQKIFNATLNLLFPVICVGCGTENEYCCKKCRAEIQLKRENNCPHCGRANSNGSFCSQQCRGTSPLSGILTAAEYKERSLLARLIHAFKYDGVYCLATFFGELLVHASRSVEGKNCILVPVPLHTRRGFERGFNQSEQMAKHMGKICDWPVAALLNRKRYTEPQAQQSREKRLRNVREAFSLNTKFDQAWKDKVFLLVDDVYTTGATLNECGKVLREAGAQKIYGLTIAAVK